MTRLGYILPEVKLGGTESPKARSPSSPTASPTRLESAAKKYMYTEASEKQIFVKVGRSGSGGGGVPFDPRWLDPADEGAAGDAGLLDPGTALPPADYVSVYDLAPAGDVVGDCDDGYSLEEMGRAARDATNADLPSSGGVLFRGMDRRIKTSEDFRAFWSGCISPPDGTKEANSQDSDGCWTETSYTTLTLEKRDKASGIDLATSKPPETLIEPHNELGYQPRPMHRIAFYCQQDAEVGGDTILVRNSDLTLAVSDGIKEHVRERGGVWYKVVFPHRDRMAEAGGSKVPSWQDKFGVETWEEAAKYLVSIGYDEKDISFDETSGSLVANFRHTGYIDCDGSPSAPEENGVWFNKLNTSGKKKTVLWKLLGDGTDLPPEMIAEIRVAIWKSTAVLRLRPGDWIVLDNFAVQHGRLPYRDYPGKKRTLFINYTK